MAYKTASTIRELRGNCGLTLGLAAVLGFIFVSPELKPNKITDDEVKHKSSIELRPPELLLIANKKLRIYSSASIAANPMLYAAIETFKF